MSKQKQKNKIISGKKGKGISKKNRLSYNRYIQGQQAHISI